MLKLLPIAIALAVTPLCLGQARAIPAAAHGLAAPSNVQPVAYVRGPRGGAAVRGPRGGVAVRGPRGGVAVRGPHRVGGRYYGGVWYGHVRRWYGGRWWPYGVGRCWAPSPIGYVWVCG
jgi:hypothetical protein